jgi:hypothetical protein
VGTGHGKSVIIQLLADMFVLAGKTKVLIVCANDFLKHWGEHNYGTAGGFVQYVSRREFLEMTPDSDTIVLIDEINLMLANNCFWLRADTDAGTCTPFCFPLFIK